MRSGRHPDSTRLDSINPRPTVRSVQRECNSRHTPRYSGLTGGCVVVRLAGELGGGDGFPSPGCPGPSFQFPPVIQPPAYGLATFRPSAFRASAGRPLSTFRLGLSKRPQLTCHLWLTGAAAGATGATPVSSGCRLLAVGCRCRPLLPRCLFCAPRWPGSSRSKVTSGRPQSTVHSRADSLPVREGTASGETEGGQPRHTVVCQPTTLQPSDCRITGSPTTLAGSRSSRD